MLYFIHYFGVYSRQCCRKYIYPGILIDLEVFKLREKLKYTLNRNLLLCLICHQNSRINFTVYAYTRPHITNEGVKPYSRQCSNWKYSLCISNEQQNNMFSNNTFPQLTPRIWYSPQPWRVVPQQLRITGLWYHQRRLQLKAGNILLH